MKDKGTIKISLGTLICIIIIVLLVIVIIGMWLYYNRENNPKNEIATNSVTNILEENNNIVVTTKEDISKTNTNTNNSFKEGTYAYTGTIIDDKIRHAEGQSNIKFSNNQFTADLGPFIINGSYEVLNDKELKCTLKSDMIKNDPDQHVNSSPEGWTILFDILDNKIKVKELNIPDEETEICITLFYLFGEHQELVKYDEITIGTWNTKGYMDYKILKDNLSEVFGTSSQYGSYLKLLENNKFEDYVYPVTEGDMHRKGTYIFDGINKLTLKYDDDTSYEVEVYMLDDTNLLYVDSQNQFVLSK